MKKTIRFLRPSAHAFYTEARKTSGVSFWDWLHGYIYTRWPYFYIGIATGEHPLTKAILPVYNFLSKMLLHKNGDAKHNQGARLANGYHGKVMPLNEASKLVMLNQSIDLGDLEQIIPYTRARELVLKNPDRIVVLDCPCRASRKNPCQPLDVCLIIGEPFATFVADHHPCRSRFITQTEAVAILEEEHARGHVHHAFFKDAMLGRFYAICNCCACCCGAMQAWHSGVPMLASSGYVSQKNADLCEACGDCIQDCQFHALRLENEILIVDEEKCMGCGVCISKCKNGALSLVRDPEKGEPLEIESLMEKEPVVSF